MAEAPLRPITQGEIDTYARDGVVCVRGVIGRAWIDRLLAAWARMRAEMEEGGLVSPMRLPQRYLNRDPRLGAEIEAWFDPKDLQRRARKGDYGLKYMRYWDRDFLAFATQSPAAEIVGRLMGARTVRFFWDQMFCKAPATGVKTEWHTDFPAWPVSGEMIPSFWTPLLPLTKENCLEVVIGSHRWGGDELCWPGGFNAVGHLQSAWSRQPPTTEVPAGAAPKMTSYESFRDVIPPGRTVFRDIEKERGDAALRFAAFDMEPGDALLIHPRAYHGAGGNSDPARPRIALSTRWVGDDIRWDPKPEASSIPGMPLDRMVKGAPPDDDELFPLVWRRDAATGARAAE